MTAVSRASRSRSPPGKCEKRIKAVLLDLDDTLVQTTEIDKAAIRSAVDLAAASQPALAPAAEADALIDRFKALLKDEPFPPEADDAGKTTPLAAWRTGLWLRALRHGGRQLDAPATEAVALENLAATVHDHWCAERLRRFKFSEEVQRLLRQLAGRYKLAIVTNGHRDVQRPKLEACGATVFFGDKVVVSGEQPQAKPHPSIFRTTCELLGVALGEAVMVGDSLNADIQGGINAGLRGTVWVQAAQPAPAAGKGPVPTRTIESVLELEAVLAEEEAAAVAEV
eukprot:TRINITY_DN114432_c0_g1_i1.p1 TRINITY_DN114432_c0_g1~~TRINITY_DN114432_c0_g1_i1.p1  ORF type:complete len:301 (+),score=54.62 TRINITY_DN114432_c0_g1_i1:55-903(+)